MNEDNEQTSLMDKYIKVRLGGATYRVRLMTLLLFAAAAIILIAAILILAFSGSCSGNKNKEAKAPETTAEATIEATQAPTDAPVATETPETTATDVPETTEPAATPDTTDFKTLEGWGHKRRRYCENGTAATGGSALPPLPRDGRGGQGRGHHHLRLHVRQGHHQIPGA